METHFVEDRDLINFYRRIGCEYDLYLPVKIKTTPKVKCEHGYTLPTDDFVLKRYFDIEEGDIAFNTYRAIEPPRSFFTRLKEEICGYFGDSTEYKPGESEKPFAICGIKNCDLYAFRIQDYVFLEGDTPDPFYKTRRENALIISSDCPGFKEVCFCRAFDINPHVIEGFDFNISKIGGGYLVDVNSDKAARITSKLRDVFSRALPEHISEREINRRAVIKAMEEHIARHKIPKKETLQEIVTAGYNSEVWQEQMKTCVECGGCIFMCETCHCFLLYDEKSGDGAKRNRIWDGCLLKNFTRVAGGANPLKSRYMRLRNRYMKKFDFFISNLGTQKYTIIMKSPPENPFA